MIKLTLVYECNNVAQCIFLTANTLSGLYNDETGRSSGLFREEEGDREGKKERL